MRSAATAIALAAGFVAASIVSIALMLTLRDTGPRGGDVETRLLVCAVLDELGADTVDPRIVDACPVP